jgi:hypothetical protein
MGDAQCRHEIPRVRHIRSKPGEIAGIVLVDPRWQKILDSWRASIEVPIGAGLGPRVIRPGPEVVQDDPEVQPDLESDLAFA